MPRDVWGDYISPDDYKKAAEAGICKKTVNTRIGYGWKVKDAISKPVMATSEEYKKYKSMAEKNGINKDTYKRRVQRGWPLASAATTPLISTAESIAKTRETRRRIIPAYIVDLAKINGICYHTLYSRIKAGMAEEQAATKPVVDSQQHPWRKDETDRINLIMQKKYDVQQSCGKVR